MKRYPGIDYSYRPNYCANGLAALLANVKGTNRRAMIRDYWEQGRIGELQKGLLRPSLTVDERKQIGKIHPSFMGGEYLPDCLSGQVEIARIECASVTADVVSIRARPGRQGIRFGIVDEYGTRYRLAFKSSAGPLSLADLIDLIDRSHHPEMPRVGLALCANELNAQRGDREEFEEFTSVTSQFYPDLCRHYRRVFHDWASQRNLHK